MSIMKTVTRAFVRLGLSLGLMSLFGCATGEKMNHIVDDIANCAKYESLNPHFKAAFEFLRRPDLASLANSLSSFGLSPFSPK